MKRYIIILAAYLSIFFLGCITPYEPEIKAGASDILVVEGVIQEGYNTVIKLSKARPVSSDQPAEAVEGAVTILCDNGMTYPTVLQQENDIPIPGAYRVSEPITFDMNAKYAVQIRIGDRQYQSDYVVPVRTPAIDEVTWEYDKGNKQVKIKLSTYDPENTISCYQWRYDEDWEHLSNAYSFLRYDPELNEVVELDLFKPENRYHCWKKKASSKLLIGNAENITDYIIKDQLIECFDVFENDDRFNFLYSMNVKQYGLTNEAYTYYKNIETNLKETGSLFGAQPTEMEGNIRNMEDPKEPVIGYISAATETTKRIYISVEELEPGAYLLEDCEDKDTSAVGDNERHRSLHFAGLRIRERDINIYKWAPMKCVDCTTRGGTKNKPDFWPNDHL